ncbi:hypothetical protein Dimus_037069 [Dionaea muscipula]
MALNAEEGPIRRLPTPNTKVKTKKYVYIAPSEGGAGIVRQPRQGLRPECVPMVQVNLSAFVLSLLGASSWLLQGWVPKTQLTVKHSSATIDTVTRGNETTATNADIDMNTAETGTDTALLIAKYRFSLTCSLDVDELTLALL